ncbi:MAG: hypothetical protein WA395_15435 [Nitrososphaeraceae archaeon]
MEIHNNIGDNTIQVQKYYPVLLTCPHGSTVKVSPARKKSKLPSRCDPDQFTKDSDLFTLELTQSIASLLFSLARQSLGRRLVPSTRFKISRQYTIINNS